MQVKNVRGLVAPVAAVVMTMGLLASAPANAQTPGPLEAYMGFEGRSFVDGTTRLPYRLFKPVGYDPQTKYPLVLFLHGGGEGGTDNFLQIAKNIGQTTPGSVFTTPENQARSPVFFVAPQSAVKFWNNNYGDAALRLVMALQQEFPNIDPQRLYLTGLSLGGQGAWYLADRSPMTWAAVVPMASIGNPATAARIADLPIWNFHSAMDDNTNVSASRAMINALKAAGGVPCYTEYPTGEHRLTWVRSYTNPDLLPWMYAQRAGMRDQYGCPVSAGGTRPNLSADGGAPDASSVDGAGHDAAVDAGAGDPGADAAGAATDAGRDATVVDAGVAPDATGGAAPAPTDGAAASSAGGSPVGGTGGSSVNSGSSVSSGAGGCRVAGAGTRLTDSGWWWLTIIAALAVAPARRRVSRKFTDQAAAAATGRR